MAETETNIINPPEADMPQPVIVTSNDWHDYALIDSGHQRKLERFGKFHFIRPEPQAMWSPRLDESEWQADGVFVASNSEADSGEGGGWKLQNNLPENWLVSYQDRSFSQWKDTIGTSPACNQEISAIAPPKLNTIFTSLL